LFRFVSIFLLSLLSLFTLELLEPVQRIFIVPFTGLLAEASATLISPFDDAVMFSGKILRDARTGFAVSIESGCNGVEASIVLFAAVLAFPAPWRYRLGAVLFGVLTIQLLNLGRIISLYYLGQWNLDVFSWVHLYLWPALIMLDVLVVFMVYLSYLSNRPVEEPLDA
jgi:exosortase H (IPTLxxWG-CTERM-specific)